MINKSKQGKKMKTVILFDTEFVMGPGPRELVRLGALKLEAETLKVLDTFDVLVKTERFNELPLSFVRLTGLTDQDLREKGVSFPDAWSKFVTFVEGYPCYSHSQAQAGTSVLLGDGAVLRENLMAHGLGGEFVKLEFHNLFPWFLEMYKKYGYIYSGNVSSGAITTFLGLPMPSGHEHQSLFDVYSVLAGLRFFKEKGEVLPF